MLAVLKCSCSRTSTAEHLAPNHLQFMEAAAFFFELYKFHYGGNSMECNAATVYVREGDEAKHKPKA